MPANKRIYALHGVARSGKDTVGEMICAARPERRNITLAFAAPLKAMACDLVELIYGRPIGLAELDHLKVANAKIWPNLDGSIPSAGAISLVLYCIFASQMNLAPAVICSVLLGALVAVLIVAIPRVSARTLLQQLGTEIVRKHVGDKTWVNIAISRIQEFWYACDMGGTIHADAVITDCRFENELAGVNDMFGHGSDSMVIYFHIIRPSLLDNNSLTSDQQRHASELGIANVPEKINHITIRNDGTLEQLRLAVEAAIEAIERVEPGEFVHIHLLASSFNESM